MFQKALIVSCFPGCGKTYCYQNQSRFPFPIIDIDSGSFEKEKGLWPMNYISCIVSNLNKRNIVLISQHEEILLELKLLNLQFYIVSPNNSDNISQRRRQTIKQQWFGRFILRDNSHISDIGVWLKLLMLKYDEWTSESHLKKYDPSGIFLLNEYEYLSDIIEDLSIILKRTFLPLIR